MKTITLFELFLALLALYAILTYKTGTDVIIPVLCLFTIFLFEKLRQRIKEDADAKERLLKYQIEDSKKDDFDEIINCE
jgi:hypothetical protein